MIRITENKIYSIIRNVINEMLSGGQGEVGDPRKGAEVNARKKAAKWIPFEKETSSLSVVVDGKKMHFRNSDEYKKFMKNRKKKKSVDESIDRAVSESIRKVLNEDTVFTLYGQTYRFKDGEERKAAQFKKKLIDQHKREEAIARGEEPPKPPKPTRKPKPEAIGDEQASPKALAANIKNLLYDKSLASVKGFKDNGERQFGPNAIKMLVNLFSKEAGEDLFVKFNIIYTGITSTIEEIESWGRKNEYAVYERARKLAYLLQDMDEVLEKMGETYQTLMNNKSIIKAFGNNANVIIGNGHSLGLSSLIFAKGGSELSKVTGNLLFNANKLMDIADSGRDAFDYDPSNLRRRG